MSREDRRLIFVCCIIIAVALVLLLMGEPVEGVG